MKSISLILSILFSIQGFAKENDYICKGKDHSGKNLVITYDEWADNRKSTRVDLTIDLQGVGPRTTVDLYAYAGDEGFDYGVTSENGSFMFHITLPPNMLGGNQVAGVYYYKNHFTINSRVILKCKPLVK